MGKLPLLHRLNVTGGLRPDQFQFVACVLNDVRASLGADAHPINAGMHLYRAIAFNRDLESLRVERIDDPIVHLQHGFAAGDHDIAIVSAIAPQCGDLGGQRFGVIPPAIFAIDADKIGIAKLSCSRDLITRTRADSST